MELGPPVHVASTSRIVLAIIGSVGLFIATVLGREPWIAIEPCPPDPNQPLAIAHCYASPPILYLVSMVGVPVLGLAAIVALAATALPSHKFVAAAAASVLSTLLGLTAFQPVIAVALGVPWMRAESAAIIVGPASFFFGLLMSLVSQRWWPNKSLERTRER